MERGAPARVRLPDTDAKPVVVRFVKLPVEGVVKPMAVLLIPVEVVLKFEPVNRMLFAPALNVTPVRPVRFRFPEVPVRLIAPVVRVRPFWAVRRPLDVIVPVPVVRMFPEVVRLPFSLIERVAEPED